MKQNTSSASTYFSKQKKAGEIKIRSSLLSKAKRNDTDAIAQIFQQFIGTDETVYYVQYLGVKGFLNVGTASFACITDRRIADISIGFLGELTYEDAYLENLRSSSIYQPSRLIVFLLFILNTILLLVSLPILITMAVGVNLLIGFFLVLLLPAAFFALYYCQLRIYYGFTKCGVRFFGAIPNAPSVYIFTNRRLLVRAHALCREFAVRRDTRIATLDSLKHRVYEA